MKIAKNFFKPFSKRLEEGKIGWALLWLMGIPLPILGVFYILRGCN